MIRNIIIALILVLVMGCETANRSDMITDTHTVVPAKTEKVVEVSTDGATKTTETS